MLSPPKIGQMILKLLLNYKSTQPVASLYACKIQIHANKEGQKGEIYTILFLPLS